MRPHGESLPLEIQREIASYAGHEYRMLIDGELVSAERTQDIADPASGLMVGRAPVPSSEQVSAAVEAARTAFPSWSESSPEARAGVVLAIADAIEARAEEVARLLTLEQGKTIAESRAEVSEAIAYGRWFATWRPEERLIRDDDRMRVVERRRPLGVVAAIVPWNFPFHQSFYKIAPALITGNTVVLKPAPSTPLNAMWLAELIAGIVPRGVVNVLGDAGDTGPLLTTHPDVSKVAFTGSTSVGSAVMRSAADTLKRVTLELGGNDAVIVLDDVDVEVTAKRIFNVAFNNAGQVCISAKRIFVQDGIYEAFCGAFAELAAAAPLGHGLVEGTRIGPVQNARQFDAAKRALTQAAADGIVIAGGSPAGGIGYFIQPTIVRDIPDDSPIVRDETFAPIRSVLRFVDPDDAVRRANATPFGLGGSVWSSDVDRAEALATRLDCGTVWINQHQILAVDVPFGGAKQSGIGCEFGEAGVLEYTARQVINRSRRSVAARPPSN